MGNRYDASLRLRLKDVTPEVMAAIEKEGPYDVGPEKRGERLVVESYGRKWGELPGLEAKLVALGVPFDRSSGCDPVMERRFRPARDGRPAVDVEVSLVDGEPYAPLGRLRELLERCKDYESLRAGLAALVEERDPVPEL